jgi:hypothetical protein
MTLTFSTEGAREPQCLVESCFILLFLLSMQAAFAIKPMLPLGPTVFDWGKIPRIL